MAEEIKEIPINKIRPAPWQPRETFEKEKIQALGESLKEKGIIQPIVVRKSKNGDGYQIIAGERRWRAWDFTGEKTIPAIIKNVDDFEAKEISIIENWHREDLTGNEKEKYIYQLWEEGGKDGRYKNIAEMAKKTGIGEESLRHIIAAGDEKHAKKSSAFVKMATADDLFTTRVLKEVAPEAREELLKFRVETPEKLTRDEMREVVKAVKNAPEKVQTAVVKLISEEKLEPKNAETFVKTLKEAPEDIQEKLIKQEITLEEAEDVKIFKKPEQREQRLKEQKMLREEAEEESKRFREIRIKQADALEHGEDVKEHLTRLVPGEVDHNEIILKRYQDTYFKVMTFRADHIKQIEDAKVRKACIDYVKKTYDACVKVLSELGEIKAVR